MPEDTSRWWLCSKCRYMVYAPESVETCPVCGQKCGFIDATCYTPECGGPSNPDPKIVCQINLQPAHFCLNE